MLIKILLLIKLLVLQNPIYAQDDEDDTPIDKMTKVQCDDEDKRILAAKWREIINHPSQGQQVFALKLLDGIVKYVPGSNYILRYDREHREFIAWRLLLAIDVVMTSLKFEEEKILERLHDTVFNQINSVPLSTVQGFMKSVNEAGKQFNWDNEAFNRCLLYLYERLTVL